MSTVQEIEQAIEALPLPERLRLYNDMPQLIGRKVEDLDWQRLGIERFFQDDSPDDEAYGRDLGLATLCRWSSRFPTFRAKSADRG